MLLKNFMSKKIIKTDKNTKILDVALLMKEEGVGSVLIMENKKLLGIVTDRDIVINLEKGCDVKVKDVMSENIVTIKENKELYEASKLLAKKGIKRLPVVNNKGEIVGVISMDDIMIVVITELSHLAEIIIKPSKLID